MFYLVTPRASHDLTRILRLCRRYESDRSIISPSAAEFARNPKSVCLIFLLQPNCVSFKDIYPDIAGQADFVPTQKEPGRKISVENWAYWGSTRAYVWVGALCSSEGNAFGLPFIFPIALRIN